MGGSTISMGGSTIWLVGMMGAGKTAVGRSLARRLGAAFHDTDAEIEARAGRSVQALFEAEGEAAFRRLEREAIEALAGQPGVVALGGGAICQDGAAERLKATGRVVYLRVPAETLARRVRDGSTRPLLAGLDAAGRLERLRALLAEREIHYGRADVVVDTDGLEVEEASAAVARALDDFSAAAGSGAGGEGRP